MLEKEFNIYLAKIQPWHQILLNNVIKWDIKKHVKFVYQMSFYYSFIFDRKIKLWNYFNNENTITIHRLYSEIAQNILGIYGCLNLWNILWAICLYRTILERTITLKIIFEDPDNKQQIAERIEKYKNLWWVLKYKYAEETNDQKMMKENKSDFDKYSSQYRNWKHFEYTKGIYWKKKSISALLRYFDMDNLNNHLYWMLSIVNHWSILSNIFLDEKSGLLPYTDKDLYKRIAWLVITIMGLSIEDMVKYINEKPIYEVLRYLESKINILNM